MRAEQILAPPRGFVWKASVARGLLRLSGADYFFDGLARLRFWLWNIIPLVNSGEADIAKSAAGRVAIESIWLPGALLPSSGASWEAVDNKAVSVTLDICGFSETLTLNVGAIGELHQIEMMRWGDQTEDNTFARIPFGAVVEEEADFGGFTIPKRLRAGWWPKSDRYFEFFRVTIEKAEY